jgi:hypothetical protein
MEMVRPELLDLLEQANNLVLQLNSLTSAKQEPTRCCGGCYGQGMPWWT